MNDNLKNQLLAFILSQIKNNYTDQEKEKEEIKAKESEEKENLVLNDETATLTESDGFDYVTEKTEDSNLNFIKLNNLNNVKIKKKSNDNAYLKVKNQEYEKIGMLIDSIETDSNSTGSGSNKNNLINSIDFNFNSIFEKNEKIENIINQYTESQPANSEAVNSEYIDIVDSNKLWNMIEQNIVKNSAHKSIFIKKSKKKHDDYTNSEIMQQILNSESSDEEFDLVESYNFNDVNKSKNKNYESSSESYCNSDSEDLIESYNVFQPYETKNKKKDVKKESSSLSDNMSIIDTYCMTNTNNNKKTTSTIEECKKIINNKSDSIDSNVFDNYITNSNISSFKSNRKIKNETIESNTSINDKNSEKYNYESEQNEDSYDENKKLNKINLYNRRILLLRR